MEREVFVRCFFYRHKIGLAKANDVVHYPRPEGRGNCKIELQVFRKKGLAGREVFVRCFFYRHKIGLAKANDVVRYPRPLGRGFPMFGNWL